MGRKAVLVLIVTLLCSPCFAQEWADKMFPTKSHNFGNVARGAKAEIGFELTNNYLYDVHIASVQSSCGCTTPRIEKDTLKTYEKGSIVAHVNSDRYLGNQGATITVTIDRPQYAQVQLHVKVHIYSDVLLEPASVVLGGVAQGTPAEQTIRVQYTGRSDWRIVEVRSGNPKLTGSVKETSRQGGLVTYDLKVILDKDAPVGYLSESVWLITNDAQVKDIPVPVEVQVIGAVSASPSPLFFGVVESGRSVTKQIVVRGQKPFRITSVRGNCKCLQVTAPTDKEPKSLYLIPVTFTAAEKPGKIEQNVVIETDAGKMVLKVPALAVISSPQSP